MSQRKEKKGADIWGEKTLKYPKERVDHTKERRTEF
jgi:hypothetical protein